MTLRQKEYVADILDRFGMSDCRPAATPIEVGMKLTKSSTWSSDESEKPPYRELVGALMYLSVATRPDISHAVNALSQYNDSFGKEHWQAAKRVLRYMKGTPDIGITFGNNTENLIDRLRGRRLGGMRRRPQVVYGFCLHDEWRSRKLGIQEAADRGVVVNGGRIYGADRGLQGGNAPTTSYGRNDHRQLADSAAAQRQHRVSTAGRKPSFSQPHQAHPCATPLRTGGARIRRNTTELPTDR